MKNIRAVLVDGSNLYYALKSRGLSQVHMDRLARWLDPQVREKRFYTAPFRNHQGFIAALESMGWVVRVARLGREREKGVDVALAVDLVLLAGAGVRHITLVSGDTDLAPALEAAKSLGTGITVAQFQDALGQELVRLADQVVLLDGAPWEEMRWHVEKRAGAMAPAMA